MLAILSSLIALAITASATSSSTTSSSATTTNVFLPIVDSQTLFASLRATSNDVKTMVIQCTVEIETSKCGFPIPVTVTAGPSTLALTTTVGGSMTVDLKCGIEGSTQASCTQTFTGPVSLYTTNASGDDGSKITTWTASQSLESAKVTYLPVTITAGLPSSSAGKGAAPPATEPTNSPRNVIVAAVIVQQLLGGLM